MVNKKAQAQIITTVLIILLVLAAIIIIWQVVSGTVRQGSEEIEAQASCLGLRIDITNVFKGDDDNDASITIRPTKDITGYQVYVDGEEFGDADVTGEKLIPALDTHTVFGEVITKGQEIEIIAKMGDAICPGVKQKIKGTLFSLGGGGGSDEDNCEDLTVDDFEFTLPESINSNTHDPEKLKSKYTEYKDSRGEIPYPVSMSYDGSTNTQWFSLFNSNPEELVFDLGEEKCLNGIQVYGIYASYNHDIDLHTLDGEDWVEGFVDWELITSNVHEKSFDLSKTQYVRLTLKGQMYRTLSDVQFNIASTS